MTKRESALVKALQAAAREETDTKISNILLMNQLAAYSMGLYPHQEQLSDGSWIFTYTDAPTLAQSTKVFRFTANGFFVSNDGGATWNSGLDSSGNLVVHILTADAIVTGLLTDGVGNNWWNLDTGEISIQASGVNQTIGGRNFVRESNTLDFETYGFAWDFEFNGEQATLNGENMEVIQR